MTLLSFLRAFFIRPRYMLFIGAKQSLLFSIKWHGLIGTISPLKIMLASSTQLFKIQKEIDFLIHPAQRRHYDLILFIQKKTHTNITPLIQICSRLGLFPHTITYQERMPSELTWLQLITHAPTDTTKLKHRLYAFIYSSITLFTGYFAYALTHPQKQEPFVMTSYPPLSQKKLHNNRILFLLGVLLLPEMQLCQKKNNQYLVKSPHLSDLLSFEKKLHKLWKKRMHILYTVKQGIIPTYQLKITTLS